MLFWKSRSLGTDQVKLDSQMQRLAFRHFQFLPVLGRKYPALRVIEPELKPVVGVPSAFWRLGLGLEVAVLLDEQEVPALLLQKFLRPLQGIKVSTRR